MKELKIIIIRKGTDYRVETYDPNWDEWCDEGFTANSSSYSVPIDIPRKAWYIICRTKKGDDRYDILQIYKRRNSDK